MLVLQEWCNRAVTAMTGISQVSFPPLKNTTLILPSLFELSWQI